MTLTLQQGLALCAIICFVLDACHVPAPFGLGPLGFGFVTAAYFFG